MMKSGQVARRGGRQALELLVVEMAGDAEAVVELFDRQPGQEEAREDEGPDTAPRPQREPCEARASDGGAPPVFRPSAR